MRLRIEKPVAGGYMLARHDGRVVLVSGALPGEVVEADIVRVARGTAWAETRTVVEASPDRVAAPGDPGCGGAVYAHACYDAQVTMKQAVIADTMARVGRLTLDVSVPVAPSPAAGYRMRARLHAHGGRLGFFREGTHTLCDAAQTGQLLPATGEVVAALADACMSASGARVAEVELAENRDASDRACHFVLAADGEPSRLAAAVSGVAGLTGASFSVGDRARTVVLHGTPYVSDVVDAGAGRRVTRHVRSFFQGNRYLLEALVGHVISVVPDGPVVDLYAGVGLFAVALAAPDRDVSAVEADAVSAADLAANADACGAPVRVRKAPVEEGSWRQGLPVAATIVVDPPRTGLSREARTLVLEAGAPRIVYVSCDVATLARDVRAAVDAGYRLTSVKAFDMFPRTAHIESVVVLDR